MAGKKGRLVYVVKYFGGAEFRIELEKTAKGIELLTSAASFKGITDCGLLGLRYSLNIFPGIYYWVDETKALGKQIDDTSDIFLAFKYYDPDPRKITSPKLRNMLYVQLRWDLVHNRLKATEDNFVKLSAYTMRIEDGAYESDEKFHEIYSQYVLWPKNVHFTEATRRNIKDLVYQKYTQLEKTSVEAAQLTYLDICSHLDRYGMYYFPVCLPTKKNVLYYIGVNSNGIFLLDLKMLIYRRIPWQFCFDGITTCKKHLEILIRPEFCVKDFGLPKPIISHRKLNNSFSFNAYSLQTCEHIYKYVSLAHCFYTMVNTSNCTSFQSIPSIFGSKKKQRRFYLPYTLYQIRSSAIENSMYVTNFLRDKSSSIKCNETHLLGAENLCMLLKTKSTRSIMNVTQNRTSSIKMFSSLKSTFKKKRVDQQEKKAMLKYKDSFRRRSNTEPVERVFINNLNQQNEYYTFDSKDKTDISKTQVPMNRHVPFFNLGRSSSVLNFGAERMSFIYLNENNKQNDKSKGGPINKNSEDKNDMFDHFIATIDDIFGNTDGLFPVDTKKMNDRWKKGLCPEKLDKVADDLRKLSNVKSPTDFSTLCEYSGCAKEWISGLNTYPDQQDLGTEIDEEEEVEKMSKKFNLCEVNYQMKERNPLIVEQTTSELKNVIEDLDEKLIER